MFIDIRQNDTKNKTNKMKGGGDTNLLIISIYDKSVNDNVFYMTFLINSVPYMYFFRKEKMC